MKHYGFVKDRKRANNVQVSSFATQSLSLAWTNAIAYYVMRTLQNLPRQQCITALKVL